MAPNWTVNSNFYVRRFDQFHVDGNDADAVYRSAMAAYEKARAGGGPSLIECLTYRYSGHSRADPAKYRPEGELEKWKERDPIKLYRELTGAGLAEAKDAVDRLEGTYGSTG